MAKGKGKKPATYEDIEALPPGWVGEILEGELVASPRPALGHGRVAGILFLKLGGSFDVSSKGPGGWWFIPEPELHLGPDVMVPDIAGWRRERLPWPLGTEAPYSTVAPDWVCEVLSPSTAKTDRRRKMPLYYREQVGHVWLVQPSIRSLEVYRRRRRGWQLLAEHRGEELVRAEPFEAVPLELGALWWPGGERTHAP
jgi:Uma2 family endonuclease